MEWKRTGGRTILVFIYVLASWMKLVKDASLPNKPPNKTSNQNTFPLVAMFSQHNFSTELPRHVYSRNAQWCQNTNSLKTNRSKTPDLNYHLILLSFEAGKTFREKKRQVCEYMSETIRELMPILFHREFSSSGNLCPQEHFMPETQTTCTPLVLELIC